MLCQRRERGVATLLRIRHTLARAGKLKRFARSVEIHFLTSALARGKGRGVRGDLEQRWVRGSVRLHPRCARKDDPVFAVQSSLRVHRSLEPQSLVVRRARRARTANPRVH